MATIKTNAKILDAALDSALVGGGSGFVIQVNPAKQKVGDREIQIAFLSSSDGNKTGLANVSVTTNLEAPATYYVPLTFKTAVATLAKVTETLVISVQETYLEVSDEKKKSKVKVALQENGVVLNLPNSPEDTVLLTMKREAFVQALNHGSYCAEESATKNVDDVAFLVDAEAKNLTVLSRSNVAATKAVAPVLNLQAQAEPAWCLVNYKFVQALASRLTGDMVQIAFAPRFMVVQTMSACFGVKRSEGNVPEVLMERLEQGERDYSGILSKKDMLLAIDVAMIGIAEKEKKVVVMETQEDGTIKVSAGGNQTEVVQKEYEGKVSRRGYALDLLKMVLSRGGEDLKYFGGGPGKQELMLHFEGEEGDVKYKSMIAPMAAPK